MTNTWILDVTACRVCKTALGEIWRYCPSCGHKLVGPQTWEQGRANPCATAASAINYVAQPATGSTSDTSTENAPIWRTVIVGLPIIRKLLAAENVELESFKISLIPDDVLWNNQPKPQSWEHGRCEPSQPAQRATHCSKVSEEDAAKAVKAAKAHLEAKRPLPELKYSCPTCGRYMDKPCVHWQAWIANP